jgi:thiamine biosynthesis protein ThiS
MGLDGRFLVVEYNGSPLPREEFDRVVLAEDDRLELVRPVAGG